MTLGENIKYARKNKGYTQNDLAEKLNVSVMTIRRFENNTRQPKLEMINRIATILEVSVEFLLEDYNASNLPNWATVALNDKNFNFAEDVKIHPERYTAERDPETGKVVAYRFNKHLELLQALFGKLNAFGKETAIDYVEYLTTKEKYTKPDEG